MHACWHLGVTLCGEKERKEPRLCLAGGNVTGLGSACPRHGVQRMKMSMPCSLALQSCLTPANLAVRQSLQHRHLLQRGCMICAWLAPLQAGQSLAW